MWPNRLSPAIVHILHEQPKEALVFSCQRYIPKWGSILSENKAARLQKQSALTLPYTRERPWLGGYHV